MTNTRQGTRLRRATLLGLTLLGSVSLGLAGCETKPKPDIKPPVVVIPPPPPPPLPTVALPIRMFDVSKQGRALYVMADDFAYCDRQTGAVIVVPRGFITDFASVPWYGQTVVRPDGPAARAAIIHDWLYAIGERDKRKDADDIFLRAMELYGVSTIERNAAYQAVRLGGENGYGLLADYVFTDPRAPKLNNNPPPPFPKPLTGVTRVLPECKGFGAMLATGWRPDYLKLRPGGF